MVAQYGARRSQYDVTTQKAEKSSKNKIFSSKNQY